MWEELRCLNSFSVKNGIMKIIFEKISKSFGEVEALKDVSFKIKPGEFVFLTGPSGAGKTTIFKIIMGELIPDEGTVEVGDWTVFNGGKQVLKKQIKQLRRGIGVVFQDFQLINEYTIEENIVLALDILGIKGKSRNREIAKVLKKVDLLERKDSFPKQLSGGELQRLCLARALAMKPKILLADEPTGNLDPQSGWQLIQLLDKINKEGTTVIMATHNFDIVNSLERRVIKILEGKIITDKKKGKYR